MADTKVASLSSTLLARKGAARPASWSQGNAMLAEVDPALGEELPELPEDEAGKPGGADQGEARLQASHIKRGVLSVIEGDKARNELDDKDATPETVAPAAKSVTTSPVAEISSEPEKPKPAEKALVGIAAAPTAPSVKQSANTRSRVEPPLSARPTAPSTARRPLEGSVRRAPPPPARPRKGRWMLAGLGVLIVAGVAAGFVGGDDAPGTTSPPEAPAKTAATTPKITAPPEAPGTTVEPSVAERREPVAAAIETTILATPEASVESIASTLVAEPPAVDTPSSDALVETEITAPSVDVIRVKGDGSAVLAGRGPAGTEWIVMHNDAPLGVVTVNQFGEWVYLPSQTLPHGAHEFSLVRKNPESKVALPPVKKTGAETAPTGSTPEAPPAVPLQPKPIGPDASIEQPEGGAPIPVPRPRETLSDAGVNGNV